MNKRERVEINLSGMGRWLKVMGELDEHSRLRALRYNAMEKIPTLVENIG